MLHGDVRAVVGVLAAHLLEALAEDLRSDPFGDFAPRVFVLGVFHRHFVRIADVCLLGPREEPKSIGAGARSQDPAHQLRLLDSR